jgi:hypothetical protein
MVKKVVIADILEVLLCSLNFILRYLKKKYVKIKINIALIKKSPNEGNQNDDAKFLGAKKSDV